MKKKHSFLKYLVIAVCVIVIVLSAFIVIGTWSSLSKVSTTAVDLLNTVEKTALTVGTAIDRVTVRLDQAHEIAQEFQSGAQQVSQNVKDQGVILTLLPLVRDQKLKDAVQSIQDTYLGLKDTVESFAYWVEVTRNLPFLRMVGLDTTALQSVGDKITGLQALGDKITDSVAEIRAQTSTGVEKVSTAVGNFDAQLTDINTSLSQVRTQVQTVQTAAGQLKTTIPTLFTTLAFLITLFLAWVIYSQVVLLRRAVLELKSTEVPDSDPPESDNKLNPGK
jgi:predicted PurR-regulated permease PerM